MLLGLVFLGTAGASLVFLLPRVRATQGNVEKIHMGMTRFEVESILGEPNAKAPFDNRWPMNISCAWDLVAPNRIVLDYDIHVSPFSRLWWEGGCEEFSLQIDPEDGKVVGLRRTQYNPHLPFWQFWKDRQSQKPASANSILDSLIQPR
jgi:hypothetical protein